MVVALLAFIGKPPPAQGEQPIAFLGLLYRVLTRLRRPEVSEWEEAHSQLWGSAIRGSSALRAAPRRSVLMEVSQEFDEDPCALLWDLSQLYDNLKLGPRSGAR